MSFSDFTCSTDKIKHQKNGSCLVDMEQDEVLMFSGYVRVCVKKGIIEINGYIIDANNNNNDDEAKYYNLYSVPYWKHCCLSIKAIKDSQIDFHPFDLKSKYRIKETTKTCDPIFKVIGCHFIMNNDEYKPLLIPLSWQKASNYFMNSSSNITNNGSIMICGRIHSGKSTFSRYLINCLLNKHGSIAYLDCDIGQSEFNPEGIISITIIKSPLFGFNQHNNCDYYRWKSYYYGSNNPIDDPSLYLKCIAKLYNDWKKRNTLNIPLIINCNGFVSGLGALMLKSIIVSLNPLHLIEVYNEREGLLSGVEMDYLSEVKEMFIHQNRINNWCKINDNKINNNKINDNSLIASWYKELISVDEFAVKEYQTLKPNQKKWFKHLDHLVELKFEDDNNYNEIAKWYHNINVSKGRNHKNNNDILLFKAFINANIHYVESINIKEECDDNDERIKRIIALRKERNILSKQKRLLSMASYFTKQIFVDNVAKYLRETDCYKVPFKDVSVMLMEHNIHNNNKLLLHALNGVLIGLGVVTSQIEDEPPTKKRKKDVNIELGLKVMDHDDDDDDKECIECVGLGIIRSINVKKRLFYVITPVNPCDLNRVNVFIRGKTNIPSIFVYDRSMLTAPLYINSIPMKERLLSSTC